MWWTPPGVDPRGVHHIYGFRHSAAPHPRRDREDGHPADPAAHELEQTGGGADSRAVSADALQQDEEARHPRWRQGGTDANRVEHADTRGNVTFRNPTAHLAARREPGR